MDQITSALTAIGGSDSEDVASCALALTLILAPATRQLIEEYLDMPMVHPNGLTARQLIQQGRADEVAAHLWNFVGGVAA